MPQYVWKGCQLDFSFTGIAFSSSPNTSVDEDSPYSYTVSATDDDVGAVLAFSVPVSPTWLSLADNGDGTATLTGTPLNDDVGANNVTLQVTDGISATPQVFTITVANTNDAPEFDSSPLTTAVEDSLYSYAISGSDVDTGAVLAFSAPVSPTWLSLADNGDGTATLSGTPLNDDVGANNVTLQVSDGISSSTQVFSVTVSNTNDAPTFGSSPNTSVDEDSPYSYAVSAADDDVGAVLAFSAPVSPTWLSLADNGDGSATLSGTPLNDDVGANNVTLQVTDGISTTPQVFTITVANTNDAPLFSSSPVVNALRSHFYTYTITIHDDDGDSVSITATLKPAWLTFNDNGDGTGNLSGTPTGAQVGVHNVSLQTTDSISSATQVFSVTVKDANFVPAFSSSPVDTVTKISQN
ncbi:MAG: hypothetical protein GY832_45090 [Chloroflexi bacterium]|nr:hypothetical protein [Chloroflexota bacterium]